MFLAFFDTSHSDRCRWYLIVVLIWASLVMSDVETSFHSDVETSFHVPVGHLYVFGKNLFRSFTHFLISLFGVFLLLSCISSLHFGYIVWKYHLPFSRLPFCFCWWFPLLCKIFLVWRSPDLFIYFCFCCLAWGNHIYMALFYFILFAKTDVLE